MASIAYFQNIAVKILDTVRDGAGELWASIETLDGSKPFVAGLTFPIRTEFATVRASELSEACNAGALAAFTSLIPSQTN